MSRFLARQDMLSDDVEQCSYDAMAIVRLCTFIANEGGASNGLTTRTAGDIGTALGLAYKLMEVTHDAVEARSLTT